MSVYLATQLSAHLVTLLEGITIANGFNTDLGDSVFVARERTNEHEAPSVVLVEGPERGLDNAAGLVQTQITYVVSARVKRRETTITEYPADPGAEWVIQGALIDDIRTALEPEFCSLSQFGASIRYDGADRNLAEGAGELTGVELTYLVQFGAVTGDFRNAP